MTKLYLILVLMITVLPVFLLTNHLGLAEKAAEVLFFLILLNLFYLIYEENR